VALPVGSPAIRRAGVSGGALEDGRARHWSAAGLPAPIRKLLENG